MYYVRELSLRKPKKTFEALHIFLVDEEGQIQKKLSPFFKGKALKCGVICSLPVLPCRLKRI